MSGGVILDGAQVRIHRDPLRPGDYQRHEVPAGQTLIDWLFSEYPAGFGGPVNLHLNGRPLPVEEADVTLQPGDIVHILLTPAGQAVGAIIVQALVSAAIAALATIAASLIFKPKSPNAHETPQADPIYSISGAQNAARLGDPVPVLFGTMTTVPDFASQPYVFFENNQQYLDQLLVIGQGEYQLNDVLVGETPVSALESDAVQYWLIGPADHAQTMGNIEAATGIMENVVSSPEVADQELSGNPIGDTVVTTEHFRFVYPNKITFVNFPPPAGFERFQVTGTEDNDGYYTLLSFDPSGDGTITTVENTITDEQPDAETNITWFHSDDQLAVGPFITSKPGTTGDRLYLDFVWPGGLYTVNKKNGNFEDATVHFTVDYQPLDASGAPTGPYTSLPYTVTKRTNTPQRQTIKILVPAGRYRVKVTRQTPTPPNSRTTNNFIWTGLRLRLVPTVGPVYGPVTLLAIRIRATNGIASGASSRIRCDITRKLPRLGSGPPLPTNSPADAFVNVYCDTVYGARRPLSEIDMAELQRIEASWLGLAAFNGGFAQKSTVWEALSIVLQTANAAPLPLGQLMSIAQEGVKANRRQLFTDANMTRGSLSVGYTFDRPGDYEGIRVEYRDPATWNALYATWPPGALDLDQVQLFGCSDGAQALQFAKLLWNKRLMLRKTAAFETELEGLLARMGDRIAVSSDLPRWGASGVVVGQQGLTLWLDRAPDWTGTGHFIILRDEAGKPSDPIPAAPGPESNSVALGAAPPFAIFGTGRQEPTHYAFGNTVQLVRDFTVQAIQPRGGVLVGVDALAYDPAAFADTLPWLMEAT